MKEVVIVSACRTAIGEFGGTLKDSNAATIASVTMQEAIKRADIDPAIIDDVRYGCCMEPADTLNVTRVSALLAGIPDSVTAVTINRVCISGMEAVLSGMAMIQAGMADVILAGGMEHMSGVAYQVPNARWGCRLQDTVFVDAMIHALHCGSHIIPHPEDGPVDATQPPVSMCVGKPYIMGQTAEFIAQHMDISRKEMDEVALRSQNNAERANNDGSLKDEIVPMDIPRHKQMPHIFARDEHLPSRSDHAKAGETVPGFRTQDRQGYRRQFLGHQRRLAAMLIMSADRAKELGIHPLAKIIATRRGACHPSLMGLSPLPVVRNLMDRHNLAISDFELVELNEAFAAQYIGCERDLNLNRHITNVNGSGSGLGHPVGATGCRIMVTLLYTMKNRGKSIGMATLCGGGGVSMACALEFE